jgi:DNA-binding PadR family transcriptional regulator
MARTRNGPTLAELSLLGMLTEGPAHPYSLDARIRQDGAPTDVAFSSIYAALARLEQFGLVTSRPDAGARGKARRVYRLTHMGRTALRSAVRDTLATPLTGRRPNDLGIANLPMLPRDEALAAIKEARELLHESRRPKVPMEGYPASALALHRSLMQSAEEKFYSELERMVERDHPEKSRKRAEEEVN